MTASAAPSPDEHVQAWHREGRTDAWMVAEFARMVNDAHADTHDRRRSFRLDYAARLATALRVAEVLPYPRTPKTGGTAA